MYIATNLKNCRDSLYGSMVNMDSVSDIYISKYKYHSKDEPDVEKYIYYLNIERANLKPIQIPFETKEIASEYYDAFQSALKGEIVRFENGDFIIPLIPK